MNNQSKRDGDEEGGAWDWLSSAPRGSTRATAESADQPEVQQRLGSIAAHDEEAPESTSEDRRPSNPTPAEAEDCFTKTLPASPAMVASSWMEATRNPSIPPVPYPDARIIATLQEEMDEDEEEDKKMNSRPEEIEEDGVGPHVVAAVTYSNREDDALAEKKATRMLQITEEGDENPLDHNSASVSSQDLVSSGSLHLHSDQPSAVGGHSAGLPSSPGPVPVRPPPRSMMPIARSGTSHNNLAMDTRPSPMLHEVEARLVENESADQFTRLR